MSLFVKPYIIKNEKSRIFIVHGICEHSGRYEYLAKKLNENGFSVITYDLRGHGKSNGKRGYIKKYQQHIYDLEEIIKEYDNKEVKRYLLGHSLGGLIAHLYMTSNNQEVDGLITSGAPTEFLTSVKPLRFIGYKWLGFVSVKNNFGTGLLSKDTEVEQKYNSDPLVLKKFKLRLAGEMFIKGVKNLNKNIIKNNKPILILHGYEDKIVPKEFSVKTFELIKHDNKKLVIYDKMYHEIFNELDKDTVIKDVISWVNNN